MGDSSMPAHLTSLIGHFKSARTDVVEVVQVE
jgi:hypothetical protein